MLETIQVRPSLRIRDYECRRHHCITHSNLKEATEITVPLHTGAAPKDSHISRKVMFPVRC